MNFENAKAMLQPRSFALLDEVASVMEAHPKLKRVNIAGHSDDRGSAPSNLTLSQARAQSVKTYLVARARGPSGWARMGMG